jgi:hypothetical protein
MNENKECVVLSRAERTKRLRSLEDWDRGFESHSSVACLSAFIL